MRKRENRIHVRMTDEEAQFLCENFCNSGFHKREDYLRSILFGYKMEEKRHPDYSSLIYELNRIGNNLNQLTRNSNTGQSVDGVSLEALKTEFSELKNQVMELFE